MVERKLLSDEHAVFALQHHEFPDEVIACAPSVAVILTQSWCPQWHAMRTWLTELERERPLDREQPIVLWELEYDLKSFFRPFLQMKEAVWQNRLVPYVRYYRRGQLYDTSNYLPRERFLRKFPL